ncbi:MAG: hypothetical protein GXO30_07290 [Epsilonproteobacteria bacterium]|nr:hypothetical protein [Campylobacterota bacterium]
MIQEFLLIAVVIAVVYFMFIKKKPNNIKNTTASNKKNELQSNDMVECKGCGIYCEVDDTIISNNKYYCSVECLKKS